MEFSRAREEGRVVTCTTYPLTSSQTFTRRCLQQQQQQQQHESMYKSRYGVSRSKDTLYNFILPGKSPKLAICHLSLQQFRPTLHPTPRR